MSSCDTLPVILVSAADNAAATIIISEIIDNETTNIQSADKHPLNRIWRIANKYYTANVRLHQLLDGEQLQLNPDCVEAHVVYLTENECTIETAETRLTDAGVASSNSSVRIIAAECEMPNSDMTSWATAHHLDLVPLKEKPPPPDDDEDEEEPFPEVYGVERIRAVLQAHPWSGLERTDRRLPVPPRDRAPSESSSDGEGLEDEEDELGESAVERAEAFAAALGALSGGGGGAQCAQRPEGRLDRAEEIVAAFCRALGYDLDNC